MNRRRLMTGIAACVGLGTLAATRTGGMAQTAGPEGTIAALQTRVGGLKTSVAKRDDKIDAQATEIAELKAQVPQPTATAPAPELGSVVNLDGWDLTVISTEKATTVGERANTQTARGVYLLVHCTLLNTGLNPESFPFLDLVVIDSKKRKFSCDYDATFYYGAYVLDFYPTDDYQPGITYNMVNVFDVPADASGFTLSSSEGVFSVTLDQ